MCGIAGWSLAPGVTEDPAILGALARVLEHRGPDDRGFFEDPSAGIGFAHNRLSIIDLSSAGHQPMVGPEGAVLSFNGEIYNFQSLRAELEARGQRFASRTDSEVVLRGFEEWGVSCLARLRGMFAFALWSPKDRILFLARDPLGMKPLYYAPLPGGRGVAFASELKAFRVLPGFRASVDASALQQYLELGFTYDPHLTSLQGVFKLPPGHWLEVRGGRPGKPTPFFQPPCPDAADDRPLKAREGELHDVLSEVVAQHLVADVPVGLLLSGGLDSSIIAALAARNGQLTTLSMGFAESTVDERAKGRRVADFVGSDHVEVLLAPGDVYGGLEDAVACVDDLFGDWGVVTTRLLYRKCRERGLKVALVGEGADELFGGYPQFELARDGRPASLLALGRLYRRYCGRRWGRGFLSFLPVMRAHLEASGGDFFHAIRRFETRCQLPNNYVMKVDKASMSVSVEARAPFLDQRVAEVALRTPGRWLLAEGTSKYLLRAMAARYRLLPEDVVWRSKFGASIAASWMDASPDFRRYARAAILDGSGWVDQLGLRDAMLRFFDRGQSGYPFPRAISIFRNLAWRLLLLNLWSRKYLDQPAPEAAPVA